MKQIIVPNDIKKAVKKKKSCELATLFALLTVFIAAAVILEVLSLNKFPLSVRVIIYTLLVMVPFLITRIPFKLRGSSWIGTVENVEVK